MRYLLLIVLACGMLASVAQQPQPKDRTKKVPERKNLGEGKPSLFKKQAAKTIQRLPSKQPLGLQQVFTTSQIGDTVIFPYSAGDLHAVVMTKTKKNDQLMVMNLKVVNYQNSFMRLTRSNYNNKVQYRGLVHHPGFSDTLVLKSTGGVEYFETADQSDVINE